MTVHTPVRAKDFLTMMDFEPDELAACLALAASVKRDRTLGKKAPTANALAARTSRPVREAVLSNDFHVRNRRARARRRRHHTVSGCGASASVRPAVDVAATSSAG